MSTLLVAGGLLVDELSVRPMDLFILDGRVQAILPPGHTRTADSVLAANGMHILPGVVDAHVHFNEPGRTDWEGFVTGSTAAAAGGVTTVCDMPLNCHPPTLDARALAIKRGPVADHALVDYAFWGGLVPGSLAHAAELQREGVIGLKAFLCDSGLDEYRPLDEFSLLDAMQIRAWTLHSADLRTRWPGNPFIGRTFRGQVVQTLVRGTVVWNDGATRVEPGFGRLVGG